VEIEVDRDRLTRTLPDDLSAFAALDREAAAPLKPGSDVFPARGSDSEMETSYAARGVVSATRDPTKLTVDFSDSDVPAGSGNPT
jgi:hypothetical protein